MIPTVKPPPWQWSQNELAAPARSIAAGLISLWPLWGRRLNTAGNDPAAIHSLVTNRGMGQPAAYAGTGAQPSYKTGSNGVFVQKTVSNNRWEIPGVFTAPAKGSVLFTFNCTNATSDPRLLGYHDAFEIRYNSPDTLSNQLFGAGANVTNTTGLSTNTWYSAVCTWDSTLATPTRVNYVSNGAVTTGTQTFSDPGPSGAGGMSLGNRTAQSTGWIGEFSIFAFWNRVIGPTEAKYLTMIDPFALVRPQRQQIYVKSAAAPPASSPRRIVQGVSAIGNPGIGWRRNQGVPIGIQQA
jgi:hypothetical protein